jgi:hypothetical protein
VEVERWGRSRRRRSDSSPPPPRAFRGYPRAPPFGAPQAPDWSSLYNWPQAPVVVAPLWPVAPPFTGWPSAPPGGTPAAWQVRIIMSACVHGCESMLAHTRADCGTPKNTHLSAAKRTLVHVPRSESV